MRFNWLENRDSGELRLNLTPNLESKNNLGSYGVVLGVFGWLWVSLCFGLGLRARFDGFDPSRT